MAVYRVDSGRSWGVCCCATIANGLVHSVVLSFGVMLPVLIKEFGISKEQTALVGALAYGVGCFTGLLAARLCDRFGLQRTHIFGTLTCAVALLSSSWATSNAILYFTYSVLFGLGMSSVFMPCFLAVAKYFRRHRCSAVGMVTAGPAAGVLVMGPSLQALVNAVGWRHAYRILSVVFVLSCALSWPFREEAPDNETHDAMVHDKEGKNREQPANRKCRPDFTVCRIPAFTIGLFSMCFAGIGHFSPPIHLVQYCEEIGFSPQDASYLFVSIGIGSVVARLLMGKVCDLPWVSPLYMNQLSMVCSGSVILLLNARGGYIVLVVLTLVYGIADGVYMTTFNVIVVNTVSHDQRSHAFGFANMALASCVCSGPYLTGLIADHLSYKHSFYVSGGLALLGAMVPFSLKVMGGRHTTQRELVKLNKQLSVTNSSQVLYERETVL